MIVFANYGAMYPIETLNVQSFTEGVATAVNQAGEIRTFNVNDVRSERPASGSPVGLYWSERDAIEAAMIYETATKDHDGLRYTVQARQCLDGSIQQRHVWQRTQAGEHDPPWVGDWIPACTRKPESAIRNMRPAPHIRDERAEAIAALKEIAAGHNDARGRAAEALKIILR